MLLRRASGTSQKQTVLVLGVTQWITWGSTYYLVTVIAKSVVADTGWSLASVVAGLSLGLVTAGVVAPVVGNAIERYGGRPVLAAGSLVLALGLVALGSATTRLAYFAAWSLLGLGMSASLYDAAFAALGRFYGMQARKLIGNLTLIGGLAMTITWPLSAALTSCVGWRGACFFYAALNLALNLPLLLLLLPIQSDAEERRPAAKASNVMPGRRPLLFLLGTNLTLQIGIGAVLAVHLLALLQGLGLGLAAAVALGSVMGVCQIGGRIVEIAVARHIHPVWEGVIASAFVLVGFALLLSGKPAIVAAAIVIYGFGNGVRTIVKGTLPLVLFGADGYAALIGRLGLPTLVAQAAGPALGAWTLARYGVHATIGLLAALALLNLILSYALRLGLPGAEPARRPGHETA